LSDFGEAKLFIDKEGTGTIKGTKEYLAPEVNKYSFQRAFKKIMTLINRIFIHWV